MEYCSFQRNIEKRQLRNINNKLFEMIIKNILTHVFKNYTMMINIST